MEGPKDHFDCTGITPANSRGMETLSGKGRGTARSTRCHDSREVAASASATACRTAGDHRALALIGFQSRNSPKQVLRAASAQCSIVRPVAKYLCVRVFPHFPLLLAQFSLPLYSDFWPSFQTTFCPTP